MTKSANYIISQQQIESAVLVLRGEKVLLDADLAAMYGVTTGALNQAVQRNRGRFPPDFMFRLTKDELENLKSQFVISRSGTESTQAQLATGSQTALRFQFAILERAKHGGR